MSLLPNSIPKATPEEAAGPAPVRVKILSCSPMRGWYKKHIGSEVEVTELQDDGHYIVWKDYIQKHHYMNRLIAKKDCVMLHPTEECFICRAGIKKGQPSQKIDDLSVHKECTKNYSAPTL